MKPGVELGEGETGSGTTRACGRIAGQAREEQLVEHAEEAFDLPAATGLSHHREHQAHLQLGRHLFKVTGGEVRSVVHIQDAGDAADVPARLGLAPDRPAQGEGCLYGRGGGQVDRPAGKRSAVVVLDDGQPRPGRLAAGADDPKVKLGVVGLPDVVGTLGLPPQDEVERLRVPTRTLLGENDQRGIERGTMS